MSKKDDKARQYVCHKLGSLLSAYSGNINETIEAARTRVVSCNEEAEIYKGVIRILEKMKEFQV